MRTSFKAYLGAAIAPILVLSAIHPAQAFSVAQDGWYYSIDSFNDGTGGGTNGNSDYEFYGMAMKAVGDELYIALRSNLGINGAAYSGAADGKISYGDLFLNFNKKADGTFENLYAVNGSAALRDNMYAIRFASGIDASPYGVGVYDNVTMQSVTGSNSGYGSLNSHSNAVGSGVAKVGEMSQADSYFNPDKAPLNSMSAGTKIGDVKIISDLSSLSGLNFNGVLGTSGTAKTQTIAFSIQKSLLPNAEFIGHLMAECANDAIAFKSAGSDLLKPVPPAPVASTPEPATVMGLLSIGGLMAARRRR